MCVLFCTTGDGLPRAGDAFIGHFLVCYGIRFHEIVQETLDLFGFGAKKKWHRPIAFLERCLKIRAFGVC